MHLVPGRVGRRDGHNHHLGVGHQRGPAATPTCHTHLHPLHQTWRLPQPEEEEGQPRPSCRQHGWGAGQGANRIMLPGIEPCAKIII